MNENSDNIKRLELAQNIKDFITKLYGKRKNILLG